MKEVRVKSEEQRDTTIAVLTQMEFKIVQLVAKGHSSKQIGSMLCISMKTVEVHRHNILKKTEAKNSAELVLELHKQGIIE